MKPTAILITAARGPIVSDQALHITPHAAYYSEEAIRTVRDFAGSEVDRVLTGQPPLSRVNAVQVASTRRAAGLSLINRHGIAERVA